VAGLLLTEIDEMGAEALDLLVKVGKHMKDEAPLQPISRKEFDDTMNEIQGWLVADIAASMISDL
jgi:hypothetical protein